MKPHDCGAQSGYRSGVLTIHEKRPELEPKAQDFRSYKTVLAGDAYEKRLISVKEREDSLNFSRRGKRGGTTNIH
jgi:hypothetical protein